MKLFLKPMLILPLLNYDPPMSGMILFEDYIYVFVFDLLVPAMADFAFLLLHPRLRLSQEAVRHDTFGFLFLTLAFGRGILYTNIDCAHILN